MKSWKASGASAAAYLEDVEAELCLQVGLGSWS